MGSWQKVFAESPEKMAGAKKDDLKAKAASLIRDVELFKTVEQRIGERVTSAVQESKLGGEEFTLLLQLETDPILKDELITLICDCQLM